MNEEERDALKVAIESLLDSRPGGIPWPEAKQAAAVILAMLEFHNRKADPC